jgi:hypothetical protein
MTRRLVTLRQLIEDLEADGQDFDALYVDADEVAELEEDDDEGKD